MADNVARHDPPAFDLVRPLFELALGDDQVDHDITTRGLLSEELDGRRTGRLMARQAGIASGLALLEPLFRMGDPTCRVEQVIEDGDRFESGALLAEVSARLGTLLAIERTALDLVQRLSGVATLTEELVSRLARSGVELCDTRKTTPGWRRLERYAVRCGGGTNHRHDLSDAAMIKDNHLIARIGSRDPQGLRACVRELRASIPLDLPLYVEVQSRSELEAVFSEGVPVVQLDGFDVDALRAAVEWVRRQPSPHPLLEATGSVEPEQIEAIAATGVDRISVDALTTRAGAIDLRMFLVATD